VQRKSSKPPLQKQTFPIRNWGQLDIYLYCLYTVLSLFAVFVKLIIWPVVTSEIAQLPEHISWPFQPPTQYSRHAGCTWPRHEVGGLCLSYGTFLHNSFTDFSIGLAANMPITFHLQRYIILQCLFLELTYTVFRCRRLWFRRVSYAGHLMLTTVLLNLHSIEEVVGLFGIV
jgi:hypothetical protein